ncbi:MAG: oxidoreductase, partial [Nitrososphaerota archaeon]
TRGGCSALCIKANMPCTGCFGPLDNIHDYGGKAISFLGSILDLEDEEQIRKEISKLPDILGLIYKYSLPKSGLRNILRSVRK